MVDDPTEHDPLNASAGPTPDPGRPKREPPTIDLEAASSETRNAGETEPPEAAAPPPPASPRRGLASVVIPAAISGAVAAALVIAAAVLSGWPEPAASSAASPTAEIDGLAARLDSLEAKTAKPVAAAPDPATSGRIDMLEKTIAALRGQFDGLRTQSDKIAATVNDLQSAPRDNVAPPSAPPDLGAIKDRIAGLERAVSAQTSELAQASARPASPPADDGPLRRIVTATLLDVLVRTGDPYPAALAAAKSLDADPDRLNALDPFAAGGVPSAAGLCRDLLTLVPKLSPAVPASETASGLVERLEAGAVKLVRIERADSKAGDRDSVVARITAAALRNDLAEARRELNSLPAADRAVAQDWIDKANARDKALAISRQFAAEAMAALAQTAH
jgi:hypothetical protein